MQAKICGYTHYIFGGEVWDDKTQLRIASNDLIIIKQEPFQVEIYEKKSKTLQKSDFLEYRVVSIRKVSPKNGWSPEARYCHQACVIASSYLVVYGGLSTSRECLGDIAMFDFAREIWTPLS